MGLDMYLNRMPRYKDVTADQIDAIEDYFGWIANKESDSKYANCTFKEWCGHDLSDLPDVETIEHFRQFYKVTYSDWDIKKECPWHRIHEQVGYWRKANAIHNWFVDNVQDGIDDCCYHNEVTKEILEELLDTCTQVYKNCTMILGNVKNGQTYKDGEWVDCIEPGKIVIDPSVAKELLPTTCGFFFGSTEYDEWYVQDIADTIDIITQVLETTDFETQMIYYVSSW